MCSLLAGSEAVLGAPRVGGGPHAPQAHPLPCELELVGGDHLGATADGLGALGGEGGELCSDEGVHGLEQPLGRPVAALAPDGSQRHNVLAGDEHDGLGARAEGVGVLVEGLGGELLPSEVVAGAGGLDVLLGVGPPFGWGEPSGLDHHVEAGAAGEADCGAVVLALEDRFDEGLCAGVAADVGVPGRTRE